MKHPTNEQFLIDVNPMRFAIAYVSSANPNLKQEEIEELLKSSTKSNNHNGITGVLLCSETNFFQLIEGDKVKIKDLFSLIEKDPRHSNIIKFIETPVSKPPYSGYVFGVISDRTKYNYSELRKYYNHVSVLDPKSLKAVKGIIKSMIM